MPRTELGKKATKQLRANGGIPVVLNGSKIVELPYTGSLKEGEKIVAIDEKRGIMTADLSVKAEDVRKLIYTPDIFEIELDINGDKKDCRNQRLAVPARKRYFAPHRPDGGNSWQTYRYGGSCTDRRPCRRC